MLHSATESFRQMRRSERVLDIYLAAGDAARADHAYNTVLADSQAFEDAPAVSKRDIALKAKEAIIALRGSGDDHAAVLLSVFFRRPLTRDGAWLHSLRECIKAVTWLAPSSHRVHKLLHSILAGVSKPHLV